MEKAEIARRLGIIDGIPGDDQPARHLLIAALLSELFLEQGAHLVVVGGTALEIYTEGEYSSKDIDFARLELRYPVNTPEILAAIGAEPAGIRSGTPPPAGHRCYVLARYKTTIDLCSRLEISASGRRYGLTPVRVRTPCGVLSLYPPEELIADRLIQATQTGFSAERFESAKLLVAGFLAGELPGRPAPSVEVLEAVCADPDYGVASALKRARTEILHERRNRQF